MQYVVAVSQLSHTLISNFYQNLVIWFLQIYHLINSCYKSKVVYYLVLLVIISFIISFIPPCHLALLHFLYLPSCHKKLIILLINSFLIGNTPIPIFYLSFSMNFGHDFTKSWPYLDYHSRNSLSHFCTVQRHSYNLTIIVITSFTQRNYLV